MKKNLKLAAAAFVAAASLAVLSFTAPGKAFARALGTWEYPSFITLSTQTETHGAPATFNGAVTINGTLTGPSQWNTISSFTVTSNESVGGYLQLTGGPLQPYQRTKAQLVAITPAVGDVYSCSDCTHTYTLVVGTGTSVDQFREVGLTTGVQ